MLQTMTKTRTTPGIGGFATTPTLAFALILFAAGAASAQVSGSAGTTLADVKWTVASDDGSATGPSLQTPATKDPSDLRVSIYPLLVWAPFFVADASVPPFPDVPGGPDLPGGSGSTSAKIDGAALAGFSL